MTDLQTIGSAPDDEYDSSPPESGPYDELSDSDAPSSGDNVDQSDQDAPASGPEAEEMDDEDEVLFLPNIIIRDGQDRGEAIQIAMDHLSHMDKAIPPGQHQLVFYPGSNKPVEVASTSTIIIL